MIDNKTIEVTKNPLLNKFSSYWEFTRPHTIVGTTITVIAIFLITVGNIYNISINDFLILLLSLMSSLLANVYIVGLNQIYDVEIDKINKPYLPLASGLLSEKNAFFTIIISAIGSIVIASFVSIFLIFVVVSGMIVGTLYSIPKTRFKTNPFVALFSIAFVRGVLGNIGLYYSYKESLSITRSIPEAILFLTIYVLIFSTVIAVFKDIPDLEGDRKFNIRTLTVTLGQDKVYKISILLLMSNYVIAILAGIFIINIWNNFLMVIIHLIIAIAFYSFSRNVIPTDKISIWRFYKKIWQFFYFEYLILTIVLLT